MCQASSRPYASWCSTPVRRCGVFKSPFASKAMRRFLRGPLRSRMPTAPEQVVCDDGSQFGSPAPCGSNIARQFAEHHNAPSGAAETLTNLTFCGRRLRRRSAGCRSMSPPLQPTEMALLRATVSTLSLRHLRTREPAPWGDAGVPKRVERSVVPTGFSSGAMVSIFGSGFQTFRAPADRRLGRLCERRLSH